MAVSLTRNHDNDVTRGPARSRSRNARASDDGVWIASLFLSLVAVLMPIWFLGTALAFVGDSASAASVGAVVSDAAQIVLISIGSVATLCAVRVAWVLAAAPRLGRHHHRQTLRYGAIAAGALALLFVQRFIFVEGSLSGDLFAYFGALAPAMLMAELSFALPAITKRHYGTAIGSLGGFAWMLASISLMCVAVVPAVWWMPALFAAGGSVCTAVAALRIWRHYEGEPLHG